MKTGTVYSVGQVSQYIRRMFSQDFVLARIQVRGEISNCKYHSSGHIYFTMKDEGGALSCVMFASDASRLSFRLQDGQQVTCGGSVSFYERDGRVQLYVKTVEKEGAGALYERYLALKQELEEMGMFAPEYKRPIPFYVRKLGVVTAPTGAAVRDIINIATRRNPWVQIVLYPAQVQGQGAAESIATGIRAMEAFSPDVIIAGRGGGSIEDLWAFNEEIVARAIFECGIPVISAVGHETDFTIADYVADLRAPTPSAAAELAVTDICGILGRLDETEGRMLRLMQMRISSERELLKRCRDRLRVSSPEYRIRESRMRLSDLEDLLNQKINACLKENRHRLALAAARLKTLSPLEKLVSGYSFVTDEDGTRVDRAEKAVPGGMLQLYFSDGLVKARVQETEIWEKKET